MSELSREVILRLLTARGPLTDDSLFVRRAEELSLLDGVVHAPHNCAWIFGAPRNGKSTLAEYVAKSAEKAGKQVIRVNARDVPPTDFDGLLRKAVLGDNSSGGSGETLRKSFSTLVAKSVERPMLVVFENFDRHAVELGLEQQAFLRSKKETFANLNYLFVTRLDPARIMEDVAEDSRLLGICRPLQVSVFRTKDVRALCRTVAEVFGVPNQYKEWAAAILGKVGGNPRAVAEALVSTIAPLGDEVVDSCPVVTDAAEVRDALRRHWRGLPSACQAFLLGAPGNETEEQKRSARLEGYWSAERSEPIRPSILIEVGRAADIHQHDEGPEHDMLVLIFRLHQMLDHVNTTAERLRLGRIFEVAVDEAFRYHPIARTVRSEPDLQPVANHLYKVFYEGPRDHKPGKGATQEDWRIKDASARQAYYNSDGMQMLLWLRQYFDHAPHKDKAATEREETVGSWFERACGVVRPQEPAHFSQVVSFLLRELTDALRRLATTLERPAAE